MEKTQMDEDHIVDFLKSKVEIWCFPRLLRELYRGTQNLQTLLTEKLTAYEAGKEENKEQISRKVRNWLGGRNQPANREEVFKICFALSLGEERSEKLLLSTAESGIHYRNPRELIYAFCLRRGFDYPQAQELIEALEQTGAPKSSLEHQKLVRQTWAEEPTQHLTISIKNEFRNITETNELKKFIRDNQGVFGIHHNTAYRKFVAMLEYLLRGVSDNYTFTDVPREKKYSIERVTEEYLRMGVPYQKKIRQCTKVEKFIKKHWPSPKMVQEMYSRKRDVNRKTLLLLYLVTEGMGVEVSEKSFVLEHCKRMDMMMASCGMALLNLHNPFDYLVVQSLNLENDDDFMSWKLERMLRKIFRNDGKTVYLEKQDNSCT